MASLKIYLDVRRAKEGIPVPVRIAVNHHSSTAFVSLDIKVLPEQWNAEKCKVENHPNKNAYNAIIADTFYSLEKALRELRESGKLRNVTATQMRDILMKEISTEEECTDFLSIANTFNATHTHRRTREIYDLTFEKIKQYTKDKLYFEDIDTNWLLRFDRYLEKTEPSPNARAIHMRNIRAVFNYAINEELTTNYPFRRFRIQTIPTRKRSLSAEQIRMIFNCEPLESERESIYMARLIFLLIGINLTDLFNLGKLNRGRAEYVRSKTKRFYSIKVLPEAQEIIERYEGADKLVRLSEHMQHCDSFKKKLNKQLTAFCNRNEIASGNISSYWLRHSWATIASELDIPKETIAKALGHGGNSVTDIYIDFDMKKVDEANRRVIDYVLYGK